MAGKKSEDKAVGMSRGGRNTKIHTLVDGLGNPIAFMLSAGNEHDSVRAIPLLKQIVAYSGHTRPPIPVTSGQAIR